MINLVDLVGYIPPRFSQNGGLGCPLLRRGPVSPNTVPPQKEENMCVLGMGCGRYDSASELNVRPFGASAGAFSLCTPEIPQNPGVYPPSTISQ